MCNMLKQSIKSVRNIAETQGCNKKHWPENGRHVNCKRLACVHAASAIRPLARTLTNRKLPLPPPRLGSVSFWKDTKTNLKVDVK
jgi:hypothetical protein